MNYEIHAIRIGLLSVIWAALSLILFSVLKRIPTLGIAESNKSYLSSVVF